MKSSKPVPLFISLIAVLFTLTACSARSEDLPPIEAAPQFASLLSFVESDWAETHTIASFDATIIYLLDFNQLRQDRGFGHLTGESSREAKLDFFSTLGKNTQGLLVGLPGFNPISSAAFETWGWDIADVDQALYIPAESIVIYAGDFSRQSIPQRLAELGTEKEPLGEFSLYQLPDRYLEIGITPDTIIVSAINPELRGVEKLLRKFNQAEDAGGLGAHPSMINLMSQIDSPWGMALFTSPGFNSGIKNQDSSDELLESMLGYNPDDLDFEVFWDLMGITFRGTGDGQYLIEFIYHYPEGNPALFADEVTLIENIFDQPLLSSRSLTISDYLSLESIEPGETTITARAISTSPIFLNSIIDKREYSLFFPIHTYYPE